MAAEKLAAKADAINYIEKMSEYFTDEQVNAWKEEVNGTESIIDTKSSKVSVHHGLVTVKQEINAELQDNLLAHIAEKTGVAYDKNGNNDELKAKYTPENWLEIESAVQAALDKLTSQRIVNNDDGQSSVLAVKEVYAAAIDKLDSIRTILRAAQDDAIEKLNTYNVRDLYRDAEWEQVQAIIAEYTAKINAATKVDYTPQTQQPDPEEGDPTEGGNTEGNGEGEAQPAADQSAEEETPSEGGEEGSGEEGDDPAVDPEAELGVKQLLVIAVGKLNAVKTKAMYEQEETEAAKESAKAELEAYKNADDYRAAQKEALAAAVEAGKTAIENASDVAGVQAALGAAKTAIDGIKTDAQLSAEENEGDGEGKKSGCNSDIFADASVWLALVLLLAGAGIAFAKKRQN